MRGERKIKQASKKIYAEQASLFESPAPKEHYTEKIKALAARYHFYQHFVGIRRYDDLLSRLEWDFFIQPRRIAEIITGNIPLLETIKKEATTKKYFTDRWPQFNWSH